MGHRFSVLHFGGQCPWHLWAIEQAETAAREVGGVVEVIDVSAKPDLAAHHRLFSPFMTVIDHTIRLPFPTPAQRLVEIGEEGISGTPTIFHPTGPQLRAERVASLTAGNISDTCPLCVPDSQQAGCRLKQAWASGISESVPEGILGFVAYERADAVGAVEFLPAPLVPYPLSGKEPSVAFITCIYSRSNGSGTDQGDGPDYRGQVLDHLLSHLRRRDYMKVQVIAGRRTPYPNGPVPFFLSRGFRELLELDQVILTEGQEDLVLMEKETRV